jgi:hypothetical protein
MKTTFYLLPTKRSFGLLLALMGLLSSSPLLAQNVLVGPFAGYSNTTGRSNTFVGGLAGLYNTTGNYNSFLGNEAGYFNTTGNYNSFVGAQAGFFNTTGNDNSFLGYLAGNSNKTGNYNSFVGTRAGYGNTGGDSNSFVGYRAGYANATGSLNSFVGTQAGYSNTTGSRNSFVGTNAGYLNTTGSNNSFVGTLAGQANTEGSNNIFLGYEANASSGTLSNAGAIGAKAYVRTSNSLVLGAIKGVNGATDSTKVGIGTDAPAYLLHVNGKAAKPGGGAWAVASDARLKKNVAAFTDGLEVLTQVKPVWFEYNGKAGMPINKTYVGVIAQEMQKIAPYMVGSFRHQDMMGKKDDYLDYDANALTYILVNSVQQLNTHLQEKDAQMEQLKQENEQMKEEMAEIRALLLDKESVAESDAAARLWQNVPNPTDGTTRIRYRIPAQARQAQISLYSLKGELLQSFPLTQRGEAEFSVNTTTLPEGVYVYRLLIDGKQVDAKKLLRNR